MPADCNNDTSESKEGKGQDVHELRRRIRLQSNTGRWENRIHLTSLYFADGTPYKGHKTLNENEHRNTQAELSWGRRQLRLHLIDGG